MLPTVLATSAMMASLSAQQPRVRRVGPGAVISPGFESFGVLAATEPRAVIGVATSAAATPRDTLGVLVSEVRAGSPAAKAGREEGNRIASINGVSLTLAAADVGDDAMAGILSRRLSRELDKLNPGDEVELHVYANGQTKSLKVKTVAPGDIYAATATRRIGGRAALGISVAVTGSARDSLGVFVMSVSDSGPAAKAGIQEGSRIAAVNGVDLRTHRNDDGDVGLRTSNVNRFEREVARAKPGDDVELRVVYNGQTRNVKVKAARASDLPHLDITRIREDVQRALDSSMPPLRSLRLSGAFGTMRW
ncbi:MAG: PDZ domain-containing protein [Gemmatimonadaceae bacterium]